MDFRFSDILILNDNDFSPVKRVCITWNPESALHPDANVDELLEKLKEFLLRDKSLDFSEKELQEKFYSIITSIAKPDIKLTSNANDLISYKLKTHYTFGMDVSGLASMVYFEILSDLAKDKPIEIYQIDLTPTVVDPLHNFMQKGIFIRYRKV